MTISAPARRRIRFLAILAAALLGLATSRAAGAAGLAPAQVITATLNGAPLPLWPPARQVSGRLYLPLRSIASALQVTARGKGDRVELRLSDRSVQLQVGQASVSSDGRTIPIGSPVIQIEGTTFVPLRFVSDALGAQVSYDGRAHRVAIVSIFAGASEAPPTAGGLAGAGARVSGTVSAVDRHSEPATITVLQNNSPQTISMTSQAK
ncbi:MAG: copper amine oxidase N-terminal domain-containing protein, partial [bacterium]|nr:copper amine oxidase N-terminal domain-containing protein [bacterium]